MPELFPIKIARYKNTGQEPDDRIQGTMKNGGVAELVEGGGLEIR